jgi:hypothetical protein
MQVRKKRELAREFCAEVRKRVLQQSFTLGDRDIPNQRINVRELDALEIVPSDPEGSGGETWLPCTVTGESQPDRYWLRVRVVDGRIAAIHLSEVTGSASGTKSLS